MSAYGFDPWRSPETNGDWLLPVARLKQDDAERLLQALSHDLPWGVFASRSLALGRELRRYLPLEPLPSLRPKVLLGKLTERFLARGDQTQFTKPLDRAVRAEVMLFGFAKAEDAKAIDTRELMRALEKCEPTSYADFVLGMHEHRMHRAELAVRFFECAHRSATDEAARVIILSRLIEAEADLERYDRMQLHADELLHAARAQNDDYGIAHAQHYRALALFDREQWPELVEASRESNYHYFQFGGVQASRRIGVNTFLTAKGMAMLEEWGEVAALAGLSLKGLLSWTEWPTKADAAFLLAEAVSHFDREGAIKVLDRIVEECPMEPQFAPVIRQAELLRGKWSRRPRDRSQQRHQHA